MKPSGILKSGENCWRIEPAEAVRFLIDGADYFHAFRETAKNAQQSILIIGWDINSRFQLEREDPGDGLPTELGAFLNSLVSANRQLSIHVLDWDFAMIYMADREWLPLYKMQWNTHRRLHFRLDSRHPAGASHHQKIAVIDDQVAFVGGLDFTFGRWDTPQHRPDDARRRDIESFSPQPYHDLQMMVSGRVASALGELARDRWHKTSGEKLRPPSSLTHSLWPEAFSPDLTAVDVAIARTCPQYGKQQAIREVQQLLLDAIASARESIYIENQYLTADLIGEALVQRLAESGGPEIVIILPLQSDGWLSQNTLDVLRERLLKRLFAADHEHRCYVYYPYIPGLGRQCLNVHAKLIIVDDELVRIGSANFNNRSMGLDTECDLAIAAAGNAQTASAISALRNRLLAEHLDVTISAVAEAMAEQRSIIRAIESLQSSARSLRRLPLNVSAELDALIPQAPIADPETAIDANYLARYLLPDEDSQHIGRTLIIPLAIISLLLLLAASWRWTPLGQWLDVAGLLENLSLLRGSWLAPVIVSLVYIIGGLLAIPVTLMIVATGITFGAFYGFLYALLGAVLSAITSYAIGQYLGRDTIRRLSHRWVARVSRRMAQQGLLATITLRIIPVAPFTVINLVAGASHIRFRDFVIGTFLGMLPGTLALTVFSDQVVAAVKTPEVTRIIVLIALLGLIAAGFWGLKRWLMKWQTSSGD